MERDSHPAPPSDGPVLTTGERRWIWVSAGLVLLSLLALVFAALVANVSTASGFFLLFTYLLEIIAATSSGILAGTITGFFKIELERHFSKGQRIMVQATGGFAVFVMVMVMSPREQMSNVADAIFNAQLADCRNAVISAQPAPDAEGRCLALTRLYPQRPEPWEILGRFTHRSSSLRPEKLAEARDYLLRALALYGIQSDEPTAAIAEDFSAYQLSVLRDVVYGAAVTTADADLRAFGTEKGTREAAMLGLDRADRLLELAQHLGALDAGDDYRIRVAAAKGAVDLYAGVLRQEIGTDVLDSAERAFRDAIEIDPDGSTFQHYNVFLVSSHRAYALSNPAALPAAKEALNRFIRGLPGALENARDSIFASRIRAWLLQIIENTRDDPFVITRPIGGKALAGESMKKFFSDHPDLKDRLVSKI